ncbi:hypothetical protein ABIC89_002722 [Variovorax boronicumulans]
MFSPHTSGPALFALKGLVSHSGLLVPELPSDLAPAFQDTGYSQFSVCLI